MSTKSVPNLKLTKTMPALGAVSSSVLGLNLSQIKKVDFHDEFMSRLDEYSQSWREAALKEKRF
jgi:hypothetical protein